MSSPQAFRFLDLPSELQVMILEHHYSRYNFTIHINSHSRKLHTTGLSSSAHEILRVSRAFYKLAMPVFKNAFTGTLTFEVEDDQEPEALEQFCAFRRLAWILERVTTFEMAGYGERWNRRIRASVLKCITSRFPRLRTVSLNHVTEKRAFSDWGMKEPNPSFGAVNTKLYKTAFLSGSRDDKYISPLRKLEVQLLAKTLAVNSMHHVKVLVNVSVWWETLQGHLLLILGLSYQVTPDGWTTVDRDWRSDMGLEFVDNSEHSSTRNFDRCMEMAIPRKTLHSFCV